MSKRGRRAHTETSDTLPKSADMDVSSTTNRSSGAPLRILFVPTLSAGLVWYRMEQFVREMRKRPELDVAFQCHGHKYTGVAQWQFDVNKEVIHEMNNLMSIADVAVFQAVHTQHAVALICALREAYNKPILAELDDDIYNVSWSRPDKAPIPGTEYELWTDDQLKMSSGAIVSTPYLKKVYTKKQPNIWVTPNAIDFDIWDNLKLRQKNDDIVRILWSGGASHERDLELVEKPLFRILEEYPNVQVWIHTGGQRPEWPKHRRLIVRDHKYWQPIDKHPQFLADINADIGICPLRDMAFNRCRSNVKYLEFSALGLPTVASDVEPYSKTITEGSTGFLAREEEDWYKYLSFLVEERAAREQIGLQAYQGVKSHYSVPVITDQYVANLREAIRVCSTGAPTLPTPSRDSSSLLTAPTSATS